MTYICTINYNIYISNVVYILVLYINKNNHINNMLKILKDKEFQATAVMFLFLVVGVLTIIIQTPLN